MKNFPKTLLLLAVVFFAACSGDDNGDTQSAGGLRIKKITATRYEDGDVQTTEANFNYSGNVLESSTSGVNRTEFLYSGNKVTKIQYYTNDVLERTNTLDYDGDKLTYITSDDGERIHYTYTGNTLSAATYQFFDEDVWTTFQSQDYVFSQNNLIQKTQTSFSFGTFESYSTYTVDTKNNPLNGMNPYLRMILSVPGIHPMSNNNAVSSQLFSPSSAATPSATYTYEIVYNADNYPTAIVVKDSGEVISETLIEYQ